LDFLKSKIKILSSAIPCAFGFFGQDIGQVSRLRLGKFTFILKSYRSFKTLTVLRETVETGLDAGLSMTTLNAYEKGFESY